MADNHNLYGILNIPERIIIDSNNNIYYLIDSINNDQKAITIINQVIKTLDKFHSYFHFEQSFANLLCAYIFHISGIDNLVDQHLRKAIFQDHFNFSAIKFFDYVVLKPNNHIGFIQTYNKHYFYEANFLHFAISNFVILPEIKDLDNAINCIFNQHVQYGLSLLLDCKYQSHRATSGLAIGYLINSDLDNSLQYALKTLDSLEQNHLKYHKIASSFYLQRARLFEGLGHVDLAKNDRIKSSNFI